MVGVGVVESEEVELGDRKDEVQDGEDAHLEENADEEALDSDEEEEEENRELQIDTEQSDGKPALFLRSMTIELFG
jgi:hypothetical protein